MIPVPLLSTNFTKSGLRKIPFNCVLGNEFPTEPKSDLNTYIRRYAFDNDTLGLSKTYVVIIGSDLAGYCTCSAGSLNPKQLPSYPKLPGYPVPVTLIGKLAVSRDYQRMGIGKSLLRHAVTTAIEVSSQIGIYAVAVEPIDEDARAFYTKYQFIPLTDSNLLFLPIHQAKDAQYMASLSKVSATTTTSNS